MNRALGVVVLVGLLVSCLGLQGLVYAGSPSSYGAEIFLFPDHGHRGVDIWISGYNFTGGAKIYVYFDDRLIATETADWGGWFGDYVEIPPDAGPGIHTIKAVDQYGVEALASFTVTVPSLYINASTVEPLDHIRVEGSGYAAYQWYLVTVDGLVVNSFVMARGNETLDTVAVVPGLPSGTYRLGVVYVSLVTGRHVLVASKTIRVVNGYVDNQSFTKTINGIEKQIQSLQSMVNGLEDKVAGQAQTIDRLNKELEALETNTTRLQADLSLLEKQVALINEEIGVLNKTIDKLQAGIAGLADKQEKIRMELLGKLNATAEKLESIIQTLNNTLTKTTATLSSKPWINYTDTQITKLKTILNTTTARLAQLQARLNNLQQTINQLSQTTSTKEKQLETTIQALQEKLNNLTKQLTLQNKKIDILEQQAQRQYKLYIAIIAMIAIITTALTIMIKKKH
ncbi:MAG: hypothetical protein GXO43_06130 [Crenarchaeota archaeon]|nr:hypothetical protein [Thermoproteota archaeon]